ncbi:hypothetical protein O181_052659 [Austropuccinia psidii MF-1]|uniref:Uncharacterized protein n=1 Tax=Austropuccinia psidii MF-1 TaxID=1389203 RepID=A0A9Q3E141_9BASI|nr:hypothetical protein [Austropuccinia psidii MF-1]
MIQGYNIEIYEVEESFIPLEAQSQGSTPVISAEPESREGKGERHSESLITAKNWTPIATQRSRKPQNSPSIQGKPTLITFTGKITLISTFVTSKGKLPKAVDNKFVQGTVKVKYPKIIKEQQQDREGLSKTRRPGRGHLGHSGGWQDAEGNHTQSAIHLPIQQKPLTRVLEGYGSSSSAPTTPQISFTMENVQQEVQPSITLGRM